MKKVILIFSLIVFVFGLSAQATPKRVICKSNTEAGAFTAPQNVYLTTNSNDTLYASDTLIYSVYIASSEVQDIKIKQTATKVAGTVSDTVYFYGSYDGITEDVPIDSIFNSNISTGKKYLTKTTWSTFNFPYLIIKCWDKGGVRTGVKSVRRYDIISKNN